MAEFGDGHTPVTERTGRVDWNDSRNYRRKRDTTERRGNERSVRRHVAREGRALAR